MASEASLDAPTDRAAAVDPDRLIAKVKRRLVPFLVACFFAAYLDRVNVGFAALTMNEDLGFSPVLFGWGAGVFFFGYALYEAPSNYVLHRVGARRWIARIMVSWGLISALMAFVWDGSSFLVLRFLLGAAEAGFAPGIILYLTYWFPAEHRGRTLSAFLLAIPFSSAIGAPLSGLALSSMDGAAGLKGWQWLFILEAIPSVVLGAFAFFYLIDRPADARWLAPFERRWLEERLERERTLCEETHNLTFGQALRHPRVIALGLAYFGVVLALYGLGMWLPQVVNTSGLGSLGLGLAFVGIKLGLPPIAQKLLIGVVGVGLVTGLPYVFAAFGMAAWGRYSDRSGQRAKHVAAAAAMAALGLLASAYVKDPLMMLVACSVAVTGTLAALPIFWTLPTAFLSGGAAAAGIALINSIGNLAGFFGPHLVGWIKASTGDFSFALAALAIGPLATAITVLRLGHDARLEGRGLKERRSSASPALARRRQKR